MANEIIENVVITGTKNGQTATFTVAGERITLAGQGLTPDYQDIPTSWTAISVPAWASSEVVSLLAIKNLDATNYVEVAAINDGTGPVGKLAAGKWTILCPGIVSPAYYARANTATVRITKNFFGT